MRGSARRVAVRLIKLAREILPAESRQWGAAMDAELEHVEGAGAALRWAAGCIWVACRERLAALWRGTREPATPLLAGEAEEAMKKLTHGIAVAAVVATLLFLLAPSFRHGLALQARAWTGFHREVIPVAELQAMARAAQERGDAETLAFAALFRHDSSERIAWAEAAVGLRPGLTWLFAAVPADEPGSAKSAGWAARLQRWAPENAYVHLYAAEATMLAHARRGDTLQRENTRRDPAWQEAMAAAFGAPVYDSYLEPRFELVRKVMRRRGWNDPQVLLMAVATHRVRGLASIERYDEAVQRSAGEQPSAAEALRQRIAFGQRMERGASTDLERLYAQRLQLDAYRRLQGLGAAGGDSALLAHEIARLEKVRDDSRTRFRGAPKDAAFVWSGRVAQASFLAAALAVVVAAASGLMWLALRRRGGSRLRGAAAATGMIAVLLLAASSLVFYLSYRPYAGVLEYFLAGSEAPRDLGSLFLFGNLWTFPVALRQLWWQQAIQLSFWYGLIAVGSAAVIWLLVRNTRRSVARTG